MRKIFEKNGARKIFEKDWVRKMARRGVAN